MEMEKANLLLFLDVLVKRKLDSLFLDIQSTENPYMLISTSMPATTIIHCKHVLFLLNSSNGPTSLVTMKASMEKSKSQECFQTKLLQQTDIHLTFNLKCRTHLGQEKLIGAASITFTQDTIDKISKLWQDVVHGNSVRRPQPM
jgi:hypothetical protein